MKAEGVSNCETPSSFYTGSKYPEVNVSLLPLTFSSSSGQASF